MGRQVIEFFSFACPHCAANDAGMDHWGRTLPGVVSFRQVPVLSNEPQLLMRARAYYVAMHVATDADKLAAFRARLFEDAQRGQSTPQSYSYYEQVAVANGLDGGAYRASWNEPKVRNAMLADYHLQQELNINAVPALYLAGRYVITPDDAQGDMPTFYKLANGILSMQLVNTAAGGPRQ